jgi:hypothetical protein
VKGTVAGTSYRVHLRFEQAGGAATFAPAQGAFFAATLTGSGPDPGWELLGLSRDVDPGAVSLADNGNSGTFRLDLVDAVNDQSINGPVNVQGSWHCGV